MTDDYAYQLSTKFGIHDESMINVRAATAHEFDARLRYVIDQAGPITVAAETIRATALEAKSADSGNFYVPTPNPPASSTPATYPTYPAQPATPVCAHGPMIHKSGVSKQNKSYNGYFCPAPQDQPRCAPVWPNS
jgi:hypothetical protein